MSSSTSRQWIPVPLPMSSYRPRCSVVASESRHDHVNGTLMVRPSARLAMISSPVTRTETALGSLFGRAAVLTPCLLDTEPMLQDNTPNLGQLSTREARARNDGNRLQPDFEIGRASCRERV